ncbi:MAG: hypothetical protein MSC31_17080 [Solirubrobacteraceae bacterium MAG38_C4-C5]|nr:hypothetical protein [Candidatus Siliceabacter maunaloa]
MTARVSDLVHRRRATLGVVCAVVLASAVPAAIGAGEGMPLLGGERNPSADASRTLTDETQIVANNNRYATRQSNKSGNGGGAIYGCRSGPGGTPTENEPCLRGNNLSGGLAFEFETNGNEVGTIVAAGGIDTINPNAAPFRTNAAGKVNNLDADRVDGLDRFEVAVSPQGTVEARSEGRITVSRTAVGSYRVNLPAAEIVGDDVNCFFQVTPRGAPAFAAADSASPSGSIAAVRTFAPGGQPADAAFSLSASCQPRALSPAPRG